MEEIVDIIVSVARIVILGLIIFRLFRILRPFEKRKINLSKIETRPSRGNINAHDFFIDCEGHQKDQKLKLAIKEVCDSGALVRILGSYPQYV